MLSDFCRRIHNTVSYFRPLFVVFFLSASICVSCWTDPSSESSLINADSVSASIDADSNKEKYYFFCDYWGVPLIDKTNHSHTTFDRVFSYEKFPVGFKADFKESTLQPVKEKQKFLYTSFSAGQVCAECAHWKVFNVYRFNRETGTLTHSFVYYTPKEDYENKLTEQKNNPYAIPYSQGPLEFIERDKSTPANYVQFGFDKSEWRCQEISLLRYQWKRIILGILRSLAI